MTWPTYLLIRDDGTATWGEQQPPTLKPIDQHGYAGVWLDPAWHCHGWVSDCGLIMPERYRRNPVGACLLACLGAPRQPYGGPVLITGYDEDSDWGGPEPLHEHAARDLHILDQEVRRALDGGTAGSMPAVWYRETRSFGELVRTADVPPITFGTL